MAFLEAEGYPKETWTRDGGRKVVDLWEGPWAEAFDPPWTYGEAPDILVLESKRIDGVNNTGVDEEGNNVYEFKEVEANYAPWQSGREQARQEMAESLGLDPTKWSVEIQYNVEHVVIPSRKLFWSSDQEPIGKDGVKICVGIEISATRRGTSLPLMGNVIPLLGKINSVAMFSGGTQGAMAIGTVLFCGASTGEGIDEYGVWHPTVALKFAALPQNWNWAWREGVTAAGGNWEEFYAGNEGGGYVAYASADLTSLFL